MKFKDSEVSKVALFNFRAYCLKSYERLIIYWNPIHLIVVLYELEPEEAGRVMFKKPTKRAAVDADKSPVQIKVEKRESSSQKVKNKSLLSFDDEEDDDGGN